MRRGLMGWSAEELPVATLEARLARLLGDFVKNDYLRKRQGTAGRIQVRGWSVDALEKVWAEEDRAP